MAVTASATSDLRTGGLASVMFRARAIGESGNGISVNFVRSGAAVVAARVENDRQVVIDLGANPATVGDVRAAMLASPEANALLEVVINGDDTAEVGAGIEFVPALNVVAVGDTFQSAFDVGVLGANSGVGGGPLTSIVISESIDPQPAFLLDLPGGNDDPGHLNRDPSAVDGFIQHINERFGADITPGVTTIPYNFNADYQGSFGGPTLVNSITERQKTRVREALDLWASSLGIQFTETGSQGIHFVLGDISVVSGPNVIRQGALNFTTEVDPTFANSLLLLESQRAWGDQYGEDFLRTVMAGVGILLGLEQTPELPASTLMNLSPLLINQSIDNAGGLEPIFPGNFDILHGQYLYNPDSNDVDLYRFEVDLGDDNKVGLLTAETFAERLSDSSLLDSTLTLYEQVQAKITTDFGVGTDLSVEFEALAPARLGNRTRIDFAEVQRPFGDASVAVIPTSENSFRVEIPRQSPSSGLPVVTAGSVLDAINDDPFASSLVRGTIVKGDPLTDIGGGNLNFAPLVLSGGKLVELSRNDDYFSEDSLIRANLGNGVYYIGVAASGNDLYDPSIENSGFGGRTQGAYDLQLVFKAQVDEDDVIRDLDSGREGVPGVRLDGDGDGTPGGAFNHWFQTRPLQRQFEFTAGGDGITPFSTVRLVGASGAERTFQFVPQGSTGDPRFVSISYRTNEGANAIAQKLTQAINSTTGALGVSTSVNGSVITFGVPQLGQIVNFEREIDLSANFVGGRIHGKTIFVDKLAGPAADGSAARPFNNISGDGVANAFDASQPGDIVRIVGNGGSDQLLETLDDNFAYEFGFAETAGLILEDGDAMEVPMGVTTMIDAGAILRFRNSYAGVGSSDSLVDRSGGALQVLGTPRLLDSTGAIISQVGDVVFTSTRDRSAGQPESSNAPAAAAADWGGLVLRSDFDDAQGRPSLENEGIFLQYVNHADIRFGGGGNVKIGGFQQTVNPIQVMDTRPTLTFNKISDSAGPAMSAAPNSFEESNYSEPRFQQAGAFTGDYDRVGPDIHHNELVNNSINGLFVRVDTLAADAPRELEIAGRFDDVDIVHVLSENLILKGTPGGPITDGIQPVVSLLNGASRDGGTLTPGNYAYRLTFVDSNGFESLASDASNPITVVAGDNAIQMANLPPTPAGYQTRRIYRANLSGPNPNDFFLVAELDASANTFFDDGRTTEGLLDLNRTGTRGRLDASLVFDPGLVTKLIGSRIELGQGTQLLAEGLPGQEVVFTSSRDDRFGAGGTFDTNNDSTNGNAQVADWGGIYVGPSAHISLDNSVVAYGGGLTRIEGTFKSFNALELQQGTGRITNSVFERNADGQGGQGPVGRFGRLANTPSTIFVRGSQPTIVGNTFLNNQGSAIDIDLNNFVADLNPDIGRQTGAIDRLSILDDNYGPLVRNNRLDNNGLNGLRIRTAELTTESIWDDTDIVHVVSGEIAVDNLHSSGGLRLQSRPDESLVVKFAGGGLTAFGTPGSAPDRVGGTLHVLGQPGFPVVLTSLTDDSVGAGVKPDGSPQTDTNNDRRASRSEAGDWNGILLDEYSNDRNVDTILELEASTVEAPGTNATVNTAQVLGDLAGSLYSTDELLRLGFTVHGYLSSPADIDTYSFTGEAGTVVWFDIDKTTFSLDTIIELLDSDGNLLARTDNSTGEVFDPEGILIQSSLVDGRVGPLARGDLEFADFGSKGQYSDFGTTNIRDAGFRVALPGTTGSRSAYSFRVRSASINPNDTAGGTTAGAYSVQLRIQEAQEFGGSVVRFADIRYAQNGIHVRGLMRNSPLLGDALENEGTVAGAINNVLEVNRDTPGTVDRPQYLGNLLQSNDASISVGGSLLFSGDVDFYKFDVDHDQLSDQLSDEFDPLQYFSTVFDIDYADGLSRPNTSMAVFWDPDGERDGIFDTERARLVLWGENSNIAEDQVSPLGSDQAEFFDRGSFSTGDAFIGPVALPTTGVYYVAVTSDRRLPTEFTQNVDLRREPIPSVARIADDRIDSVGGTTAEDPAVPILIPRDNLPAGWAIDTRLGGNRGHGEFQQFDNTDSSTDPGTLIVQEFERNDPSRFAAQNLEANPLWNLRYDGDVGTATQNTSLLFPYIKVRGTGDGTVDGYRFTVPADGTVIIDVDEVTNGFTQIDDDQAAQPVDLRLVLIDSTGAVVATNNGVGAGVGQGGSNSNRDPFIQTILPAGNYTFAVGLPDLGYNADDNVFTGTGLPQDTLYTLNVSVEGHAFQPAPAGNQSLHYVPTGAASSVLRTNAMDLGDYTAEDQPFLYFNYFRNGGNMVVNAITETGATIPLAGTGTFTTNTTSNFLQARISLDTIAGLDNVRLEFVASGGVVGSLAPAFSMDDFVVGFAERGERIANAAPGQYGFSFTSSDSSILSGNYQLEIRPGEIHSTAQNATPQQVLTRTFDTNARLAPETVTLIAPAGRELSDGNFFELNDGATSIRFEFNSSGSVTLGSIPVPFATTDSAAVVAQSIRNAINNPNVQAILNIEASSSGGIDNGPSQDNRIDLVGPAEGDFRGLNVQSLVTSPESTGSLLAAELVGTGVTGFGNEQTSGGAGLGVFEEGSYTIGLESGVIVSTGPVAGAMGPNLSETTSGIASGAGDLDLDATTATTSVDSSSLEFDFQVDGTDPSHLFLQVVFASEEFTNDALINQDQLAVLVEDEFGAVFNMGVIDVAGTPTPIDSTTVGPASGLYTDNSPTNGGNFLRELGFDGFSQVLTLSTENTDLGSVLMQPGRRYTMKIVVGDNATNELDSALFIGKNSLSTTRPANINQLADPATGRVTFPAVLQDSFGDRNVQRTQSQIVIDSNTITDSKVYGVWSQPGERATDPFDRILGESNNFLQTPRLGNTGMGAIRNLPAQNDSVIGGLTPGVTVINNIIDNAQLAGINIEGELRPLMIIPNDQSFDPDNANGGNPAGFEHFGEFVTDGDLMTIDAGNLRVVFEFEEISGGAATLGVREGHVPIYYRRDRGPVDGRSYGYNKHEMLLAIREAILNSPLAQNDMVQLVDPVIADNLFETDPSDFNRANRLQQSDTNHQEPALYVYGASGIYFTSGDFRAVQAPIHEGAQPFARVINNTIVGRDGSLASSIGSASDEPNDTLANAVQTHQGVSHSSDVFTSTGQIGDSIFVSPNEDVDFFQVELDFGDRVLVDIDTNGAIDTVLRVFNSSGQVVTTFDSNGDPQTVNDTGAAIDETLGIDPFIDFTALEKDTYFIGVSASQNETYDALSLGQRLPGSGTGQYDISIEVRAPRQFVIQARGGAQTPAGSTFTIEQVANLPTDRVPSDPNAPHAVTFEFTQGDPVAAGNLPILYMPNYLPADMALALSGAINGFVNGAPVDFIPLPNHADPFALLPDGSRGPVAPVRAMALGGPQGAGTLESPILPFRPAHAGGPFDSPSGFGYNTGLTTPFGVSSAAGSHELFVLINNAAEIRLNTSGVILTPGPGSNEDQVVEEVGVMAKGGASPTLLNNVLVNQNAGVFSERTSRGFAGRVPGGNAHPKPGEVIVGGSVFHAIAGAGTNTNSPSDDFNYVIPLGTNVLADPLGEDFLPVSGSLAVDSAIDSLAERAGFASLKQALGIAVSPVLAPNRDNTGQLRADDPDTQTPSGLGANVFKDRGALDLADFIGPVAIADLPKDNDSQGIDTDPAVSFLQLSDGTYGEFRIQLIDTGDASDPFPGSGISDDTVVGAIIEGLRKEGASLTLFENGRLLEEGIDYTFTYDSTRNQIRLTPLAGIWRNDRSYRIDLNNRDRFVVIAPSAGTVSDGELLTITDENGGGVSLEFESGYEIELPEVLTLTVPVAGTGAGGISDADRFTIDDGTNPPVTFEFDSDQPANFLDGNIPVPFVAGSSQETLAANIAAVIAAQPNLDVSVVVDGANVIVGTEAGATIDAFDSGLLQAPKTVALQSPIAGVGPGGIEDGDIFTINDGEQTVVFEFQTGGGVGFGNVPVLVAGATQDTLVSAAILEAIDGTSLNIDPTLVGERVLLDLPRGGIATAGAGQLRIVGISRTPTDATTLTFTPVGGGADVVFELNRTDLPVNDGVAPGSIAINYSRTTTADDLADQIAAAVKTEAATLQGIAGVDPLIVEAVGNGVVAIGGEPGLGLVAAGSPGVVIEGAPGVTGKSALRIFGPLQMQLPQIGAVAIPDNSRFTMTGNGQTIVFEYTQSGFTLDPLATPILYSVSDSLDVVADATALAINNAGLGIVATSVGQNTGTIGLGQIDDTQIDTGISPLTTRRGIVQDGDFISIAQGGTSRTFEFEVAPGGGGVTQPGAIPVTFQATATPAEVAAAFAAAINNNKGTLELNAVAVGDAVELNDVPGTNIDVTDSPRIELTGVPGGAQPVRINRSFTSVEVKQALIDAINSINIPGEVPFTTLSAVNRGGNTLFIENARSVGPQLENYFLQAISDNAGRDLKPNRSDNTTQFTILMPEVGLDFGDAPDPVNGVRGRYPTLFDVNGARHVIGLGPVLGTLIDADANGQPTVGANGDDTSIEVTGSTGTTFVVTQSAGQVDITLGTTVDGDTLTIDTGIARATFEFDDDGQFNEDNFAVTREPGETIGQSLERAFLQSPLRPADLSVAGDTLRVIVDDEDGVVFVSPSNPAGVFNKTFDTPVAITVTGAGVLDAWIDFNGDGDWSDPGEQIISRETPGAIFADNGGSVTRTFNIRVPDTTAEPNGPLMTYARFRLSTEGGLNPTGLALSGEVEDYQVRVLPGAPPTVTNDQLSYDVQEDLRLEVFDVDGALTPSDNDNGVLTGITDPNSDDVAVFADDVGIRRVEDANGDGGVLELDAEGTFSFTPDAEFFGTLAFTFRVTDVAPNGQTDLQLVNPTVVTVTLNVASINDAPEPVTPGAVQVDANLNEDQIEQFTIEALTEGLFVPGPTNEFSQPLVIDTVGSNSGPGGAFVPFVSEQGGTLQILADGSVQYTPPADYNTEAGRPLDRFIYTVADVPPAGQVSQTATEAGTVVISLDAVNDPPVANTDSYDAPEDGFRVIPVSGPNGIVTNDTAGPSNESAQTISLIVTDFPRQTQRGGTVTYSSANGGELTYTPPLNFSGQDQLSYRIQDSEGAIGIGTVLLNVDGDNDPADFIGINGIAGNNSLSFTESKTIPQEFQYDLSTWFVDPEGDALVFEVTSSNADVVVVNQQGADLTLELPSFGFGSAVLTVRAINAPNGPVREVTIPVNVADTPDPPILINSLGTVLGEEDELVVADLSQVFADPDRTQLNYRVISPSSFVGSSLVQSITFVGDQMRITLVPDASGQQEITIGASDGTFEETDTFTLDIAPVQDAPVGLPDGYSVTIGGRLSVLDPLDGILSNDFDPDGDDFTLILDSSPTKGQLLELNPDGTFVYVNQQGAVGETDSFTYRLQDPTGISNPITVTLNLQRSAYQNPLSGLRADVTADGFVTAVDALRVINLLNRRGVPSVPVSTLTSAPPDFVDVNGDGTVNAVDALDVILELNRRNRTSTSQGEGFDPRLATTTAYAAIDSTGLRQSNVEASTAADDEEFQQDVSSDDGNHGAAWQSSFVAVDNRVDAAVDSLMSGRSAESSDVDQDKAIDRALSDLFAEITLGDL